MSQLLKWIENIWKIREIFDKYLPMVKAHRDALLETYSVLRSLQTELDEIKEKQSKQQVQLDTNFSILADLGGAEDSNKTELVTAVELK